MIGPALAAAAVVGVGSGAYAGWPRWRPRLSLAAVEQVRARPGLVADLAVVGSGDAVFVGDAVARCAAGAVGGLVLAAVAWTLAGASGLLLIPFGVAIGLATTRRSLSRRAGSTRAALRQGGLELAELVSLAIGAGLGVPAALERGLRSLRGEAGDRLRAVCSSAAAPWSALESFAEAVAVPELADFARTLALGAEAQGRTREVLLGWAQAARAARLEEAEAAAGATTEAMTGPLALVAFGFLFLVGVPAVLQLLSGVSGVHL